GDGQVGQVERGLGPFRTAKNTAATMRAGGLKDTGRIETRLARRGRRAEPDFQGGVPWRAEPSARRRALEGDVLPGAWCRQRNRVEQGADPIEVGSQLRRRQLRGEGLAEEVVVGRFKVVGIDERA